MPDSDSSRSERLAPHPVLERYYRDEDERPSVVRSMFDESASEYDWIERFMSFGMGIAYRKRLLKEAGLAQGMRVLDVATGTGSVARAARELTGPKGHVAALDPSIGMLRQAKRLGSPGILLGRGEALPFADEAFDFLSMGYALRHVADLNIVFHEYARALRPGGRVAIFEISRPSSKFGVFLLGIYLGRFIPLVTRMFGHREAARLMHYYWRTIKTCVPPSTIVEALRECGFSGVERKVQAGIFSSYLGVKR
ncbi:MAG TPA: class I SAM-dependent methyltransferase [Thermoanaerobaculia bacterium]|nr:class I SAM-dependent methyltransferase [Thermoanaerobaculia bacterium]